MTASDAAAGESVTEPVGRGDGPASTRWQLWIDRGGTFTDCIGRDPDGRVHVVKVPSSDRAPLVGIRRLLGLADDAPISPCDVRMGTTIATNALLERKGEPCGLVITRGFRDLLDIGAQDRPEIFDLVIARPERLYADVAETAARSDAAGETLVPVDREALAAELQRMRAKGLRSLAVVVLHAYRATGLEKEIGALAREAGFDHVSLSHEVAAELGIVGRGDTTVVDAYLTPLIRDYVAALLAELPGSTLRLMQSSGGLTDATRFRGRNSVLSGPAAGVVACAHLAREAGLPGIVGFDMGGTSTDVSRFDGAFERTYETTVAGVRLRAPMMAVHTVAAGGGSICRYRGFRLTVGPDSAGAAPGPLCYGDAAATEVTVTDANLLLGRVVAERFPVALDGTRVAQAFAALARRVRDDGTLRAPEDLAAGFVEIADQAMAEAIRQVTIACGRDVREYALVVFGGAGGQHACSVARRLGIRRILFHRFSGVLSAWGMGLADVSWSGSADAGRLPLEPASREGLRALHAELEAAGRTALGAEGFAASDLHVIRRLDLRYRGADTAVTLDESGDEVAMRRAFEDAHAERFGFVRPEHVVEVVTARVEVAARGAPAPLARPLDPPREPRAATTTRTARLWVDGAHRDVPLHHREELAPGSFVTGPAVVLEETGTIVLDRGFRLDAIDADRCVVSDVDPEPERSAADDAPDPVRLEVFNHLFMSIATQMGTALERTAVSTNIRERRDFSCALFDAAGGLVANAPHIPVHLGAMGESVRAVLAAHPEMRPGDVYATNDPAGGGSHLPDVTVVTPVHDEAGSLLFFTASRGHHADVGGITPGSMPPFSSSLTEEGVVLRGLRIVNAGRFDEGTVRGVLGAGSHPARNPDENVADLQAQIAANRTGAVLLAEVVRRYGLDTVRAYMRHVQENAAAQVAAEIARLAPGERRFRDALDDGTPIEVAIRVEGDRMEIDFAGTGAEVDGNLNAPRAVTMAAVIYVLRTLVSAPIPLNSGCLAPVRVRIPAASLLDPSPGAAVCGGNVETSQRIVDVLLGALGLAAASQGTMNNLTFGDAGVGYYETIAGGAGAGRGFAGASGVHTHMTNTRITDPEVLESRFPVRLVEFSLRRGSGGGGTWRGGDGVVREIELLRPLDVSILSERRVRAPFGLAGGGDGAPGRNTHNGRDVGGKASFRAAAGDRIRIETPGGGGYGR